MKNFIEVTELKKVFGDGEDEVHAFGPATININAGEFVSVLGPSGCGKSTLNAYGCWIIRFNKWKSRI
jgi:ABC-type lipoprotein export system ATPase subunit